MGIVGEGEVSHSRKDETEVSKPMLTVVTYPNPVLRKKARPIDGMDDDIRRFIDEMTETMYVKDGVGLAAPQVGVSKRFIVVDGGEGPMSLMNPEIVSVGGEQETLEEGCLSLPDIRVDVLRTTRIVVRGINETSKTVEIEAEGLLARVLQHEIDHLNGILIIDHASSIQRALLKSRLRKLEKSA